MQFPLSEVAYKDLVKQMSSIAATKSTLSKRRGYEQDYFQHHKALGIRLRGKYRIG